MLAAHAPFWEAAASPGSSHSAHHLRLTWHAQVRVDPRLPVRNSMMKSLTQHNPTVCLQADDLQALNALYPDCENPITTPVCFPISHNIGYVRFAVYTLIPIIIALLVAVCIGTFTQRESLANAKHQSSMVRIHAKREQSAHRRENEQRDLNEKERKEMPRRVRRLIVRSHFARAACP
jgi:hypothetical protein